MTGNSVKQIHKPHSEQQQSQDETSTPLDTRYQSFKAVKLQPRQHNKKEVRDADQKNAAY